jgi:hypothetical protein
MPKDTPAPAAPKPIPKPVKARLIRIPRDGKRYPAAVFKGDEPKKGASLKIDVGGAIYQGIVHEATEVDGEIVVEFRNGLSPAK